ncbi:hypothetical protein HanIR_Chr05g0223321 [Helianthus annuus]|nr:hypothetical protein HanIR_Chr05g0223321 [Helianthus annuus]
MKFRVSGFGKTLWPKFYIWLSFCFSRLFSYMHKSILKNYVIWMICLSGQKPTFSVFSFLTENVGCKPFFGFLNFIYMWIYILVFITYP